MSWLSVCRAALVLSTAALWSIPTSLQAQEDEVGIPLGSSPDPVLIEDLEGNSVDLGAWIGHQPVLLEFWARWCEQCEALLPRLREAHARHAETVVFLAIGVGVNQNPRSIKRHLNRHPMPFPVLWDGQGKATRRFMAPTTSYIVVLDADGRVVYTGVGPDQDIGAALARALPTDSSAGLNDPPR